jgi:hypothetical protein
MILDSNYFLLDTEAEFRRIRIKTDLVLMPLLWILGGLRKLSIFEVFLWPHVLIHLRTTVTADKGSIGAQATFGIRKDTHLVGQQFACEFLRD